jgi:hypothetical protein
MVLQMAGELESSRRRVSELERAVEELYRRLQDDVEAAHRSHRYELVPVAGTDVQPHRVPRRQGRRPT